MSPIFASFFPGSRRAGVGATAVTRPRRRAAGVVRTLVVGSATLAILFVCFSMYQYAQSNGDGGRGPRFPSPRLEAFDRAESALSADAPGVAIGDSVVGPGRNIQLTIYPREGSRAALDLEVRDWTPRPGAVNEFILIEPVFRMRTPDGHAVRISAKEGRMEANRQGAGDLNAQRGRLFGGVVVEFDRLTEEQRAALPEAKRDPPDPRDLLRVDMEEVEFDLDYDKLVVPGEIRLTASDASFVARELEVRFNEAQNRIESMRISRGGRLELRGGLAATSLTGLGEAPRRESSVVDWLRDTLRKHAVTPPRPASDAVSPGPAVQPPEAVGAATPTNDGVPVFRPDAVGPKRPRPPIRYHARIEGDVAVEQLGDAPSRLLADVLEIQRDVTSADRRGAAGQATGQVAEPDGRPDGATDGAAGTVVVEWSRRLVVDALSPDDPRRTGDESTTVMASGAPARVEHIDGDVSCDHLHLRPDRGEARMTGSPGRPAVVRSTDRGTMSGADIALRREADKFFVSITGPGELVERTASPLQVGASGTSSPTDPAAATSAEGGVLARVEFAERVEAEGRIVTRTVPTVSGRLATREFRVLDKAVFGGQVSLVQRDARFGADAIEILFAERRSIVSVGQVPHDVRAKGHVTLTQREDRLLCRELQATLRAEADDRVWPERVEARGDVTAGQGDRSISATDGLVIDFELVSDAGPATPPVAGSATQPGEGGPGDPAAAERSEVSDRGTPPASDGGRTPDTEAENDDPGRLRKVVARRVSAEGDVVVSDASQAIEIRARRLEATLLDGRDIDAATLLGDDVRPAQARLDDFSVAGREIRLDVPDQWAEVPGGGRLTFRSDKDLDGRALDKPLPIAVTWTEGMRFLGRENRAVFSGSVHATSERNTTFDAERLLVEFEERGTEPRTVASWSDLVKPLVEPYRGRENRRVEDDARRLARRPAHLLATGNAVAVTAEETDTGELRSRARIAGPKLSVNLRRGFSRMLIEGAGTLLLEDFQSARRPADATTKSAPGVAGSTGDSSAAGSAGAGAGSKSAAPGLLAPGANSGGPSKTLIAWRDTMWYDFAIDQTRFEGAVELKHFSGSQLERVFRSTGSVAESSSSDGRSTFLKCDVLTAEFQDRKQRRGGDERMGRLNSSSLRQFQATGDVELQDETERLALWSDSVVFERERQILAIFGSPGVKARIIKQDPGRLASHLAVDRAVYNLATGNFELSSPQIEGR